ncbi:ABC transporter permease [Cryobacterium breve]|jgi:ribose transport system permease protein|uniref:ABC transporter permease n=1 Tax=Cryobacterium breve TaxID=1259258 RepID=A0ABY7NFG0_9MICO|nr:MULTISPECIES: ABC transporter permease [Cryobacterium]MDY7541633.1 ABC transporter permease [Cryobacterium sp. 5B3]MEA9999013.1 ABC transporter permease [Cryobacterium sp. RTS3]MEB0267212.1 ABC transporter permease [Cryobacterium sp. 10I5]MEB0275406.1 ABC transporter permease [Cryobacterium sp. 5B3]WBM81240.1 ABC transporter permease [Cryobacterium breve]
MTNSNQTTTRKPGIPAEQKPVPLALTARISTLASNQSTILIGVMVLLIVVFSVLEPKFFSALTASNILTDWGSVVLIAVGQTFVVISGGIDLSVGAIIGLSGVVSAWTMANVLKVDQTVSGSDASGPLFIGTLVSVGVGLLVGLTNAFLINKLRIVPFIATLSTMGAALGLSVIISSGQPIGSANNFDLIAAMDPKTNPLSWALIVVIVVVTIAGLFLHKARFGLYTYAIGSNTFAARGAGINVERHLTLVYALSGALAGLAGMYVYLRLGAGSPSSGTGRELDAIAAVVIGGASLMGGIGRIWGTVLGALILFTVQSGLIMVGVAPDWKKVVVAILIAAAVAAQTLQSKNGRK